MMKKEYMQVMLDSLTKKKTVLNDIIEKTLMQREVLSKEEVNWDLFDVLIDEKTPLINYLVTLDQGFAAVFEKIKGDLELEIDNYRTEMGLMQVEIREISELSAKLETLELRNKKLVEEKMSQSRQGIKKSKKGSKAAMEYYQRMNKINTVDPQLMDKKS